MMTCRKMAEEELMRAGLRRQFAVYRWIEMVNYIATECRWM